MHDSMLKKLDQLQKRLNEIETLLVDPETVKDIEKYTQLNKEFSELKPIVEKFDEYNKFLTPQYFFAKSKTSLFFKISIIDFSTSGRISKSNEPLSGLDVK